MAEKKDFHIINSQRSTFSGNFRSGLRLPVLDAATNQIVVRDDCIPVSQNATFIATTTCSASANKNYTKNYLKINHHNPLIVSRSRPKWNGSTFLATGTGLPIEKGIEDHESISNKIKVHDSGRRSSSNNSKPIVITHHNDDSVLNSSNEEGGGGGDDDESSCGQSEQEVDGGGDISKSRKTSKGGGEGHQLETEINQRITSVYRSIENLERKRINFNNSIRAAARRTISDGIKNKVSMSKLSVTGSATTVASEVQEEESEGRRKKSSSRIIDVTRTYKKMFGLDPMKVIASSEDDSDMDDNGGSVRDPRKKTKKSIRKYLEQLVKEEEPRDMSVIMPTMSEKTFLTKLQKRESQLNKEINDMRNNLDVMNMKAEREAKKAQADRNKDKSFNKRLNVTKLLASGPDKGPARELTDYLQATGGSSGGWEIEDHMVFLRALRKWSTRPMKLVDNLCQLLSNKKPEEIVKHIEWQEKYEKLSSSNRDHIRQWQINRRREREVVYQMASESQKARLENEKRHQDLIRYRRAEEREKNHHRLSEWKRSKARERSTMKEMDGDNELDTSEKIAKMDLEMTNVRKEIREITAMTRDIGKSLQSITKTNPSDSNKTDNRTTRIGNGGCGGGGEIEKQQRGRQIKTASEASSGFCEVEQGLSDGDNYFRSCSSVESRTRTSSTKSINFCPNAVRRLNSTRVAETKNMLKEFRNRDDEMIEAKKKAILEKKKNSRNAAFLTDKQIKERMKKITVPSKLMCPTKGWMIRKEILEQEKVENQHRDRDEGTNNVWTSDSKDNFLPASYVNNIPKLGTPSWRKTTAR